MALFKRRQPEEEPVPDMTQTEPITEPITIDRKPLEKYITEVEIAEAVKILEQYRNGKQNLENRIVENEQWWKLRHWSQMGGSNNKGDPEPASAWLVNSIVNKHADAMDNFPEPSVLPREMGDSQDAEVLSDILPVILEQNDYEQTYSDMWWYKLKTGTGVTGVFWNPKKNNGLGDIDIKRVDMLNLFWQPGITDIQDSKHLFCVKLMDNETLIEQYPQLNGKLSSPTIQVKNYLYDDMVDVSEKSAVVDWYYKKHNGMKDILHYCKFCNGEVLYSSEDDENYRERGFYDHAKYPFIFDVLFMEEGTPAGYGYIDICKDPQMYIDKLNQVILKNAIMAARPRWFVRADGDINEAEYADWSKDFVHYTGSGVMAENIVPIKVNPVDGVVLNILNGKIEELKETSGNRDFSQGGTASGVTAASAIAALQEAGTKTSRDMIKSAYRSFREVNYLVIELIRQFYDEPRQFRIIGDNSAAKFIDFSNQSMRQQQQGDDFGLDMGFRMPIYDIKVSSQKSSPFSTAAQNERAKELYGMGFFRPDLADQTLAALDMMQFEGIDEVRQRIAENGTMYQQLQQLTAQMAQLAQVVDMQNGTTISQGIAQEMGASTGVSQPMQSRGGEVGTNALGDTFKASRNSTAGAARLRAAENARPT